MSEGQEKKKLKMNAFTIIKDDPTDGHGGYGAGSISLENMSPIIVDPTDEEVFIDMDAMHGRAKFERRVKYTTDKAEVPDGKPYWICWTVVERGEDGPYYSGIGGSEIIIDRPNKRGYKQLGEHVKHMEKALKGEYEVAHLDHKSKKMLREFLIEFDNEMWIRAPKELKLQLRTVSS
ncbi:MAG TPA: YwhD family protein [Candidatus Avamphibacillus intestinigallinarum]|nr:YwhD family protein [Candidatus Avamphibacillus intestinigallinarum]